MKVRISSRAWRRIGLVFLFIALLVVGVGFWAMPRLIVARIRAQYGGFVTIGGWWINARSAGVKRLALHETEAHDSPVWAFAERATTDISLTSLLHGRIRPRIVGFRGLRVVYRIARDGKPLTKMPFKGNKTPPELRAVGARLTFHQEGRPPMLITGIRAQMRSEGGWEQFWASSDDPTWSHTEVRGRGRQHFHTVTLRLTTAGLIADRAKVGRIPWVSPLVWKTVEPSGPVGVDLTIGRTASHPRPIHVHCLVSYDQTTLVLGTLQLVAQDATGRMDIRDKVVRLERVRGRMLGGRVTADGVMDFSRSPSRFDMPLTLEGVEVGDFPIAWGLDVIGITGRLTGTARLKMVLDPGGADLTGSTGTGTVASAALRGVPLQTLNLTLSAPGERLADPAVKRPPGPGGAAPGFFLPQVVTADFHVDGVELMRAMTAIWVRGKLLQVPITGWLGLKARARIPFGLFQDLDRYSLHGAAELRGASIGGLDLGDLRARVSLEDSLLDVSDLRGRLVDRPGEAPGVAPTATGPPPSEGPLPPGAFRGGFRTALHSGRSEAHFEGNALPVSELAAPMVSHGDLPTGWLTIRARGEAATGGLSDPAAWTASGRFESPEIAYRTARFRAVASDFRIRDGRLELPDLSAHLDVHPLRGRLTVGLAAPSAFQAGLALSGVPLGDLLALASGSARSSSCKGTVAARGEGWGTLRPWRFASRGTGRIDQFQAGPIPLGDLPLSWRTEGETIRLTADEVQRLGGRLSAEALIPVRGRGPIRGTILASRLDTAQLSALTQDTALRLRGRADGRARFVARPGADSSAPLLEADARLTADSLTIQGVPANALTATLKAHHGLLAYDVRAEILGGSVLLLGDGRLYGEPSQEETGARLLATGLRLGEVWKAAGLSGSLASLKGQGDLGAGLRTHLQHPDLRARGWATLRELRWAKGDPVGNLRLEFTKAPTSYQLGPVTGELLGGPVRGLFREERTRRGTSRYHFALDLRDASLSRALGFSPRLARNVEGVGRLHFTGVSEGSIIGHADLAIRKGRIYGLDLGELRIPAILKTNPYAHGSGLLEIQPFTARLAKGRVRGKARLNLGQRRDFEAELAFNGIDLSILRRIETEGHHMTPGTISGTINLHGPDPAREELYRGQVVADLTNASIYDLPIFHELDEVVGSARGGLFQAGELYGTVVDRKLHVDQLTLVGPLAQLHATGSIGFDGHLDLVALINTNRVLPSLGQSVNANLGEASLSRREVDLRLGSLLASRLMKVRITGTASKPAIHFDSSVPVGEEALAFFGEFLRIALEAGR